MKVEKKNFQLNMKFLSFDCAFAICNHASYIWHDPISMIHRRHTCDMIKGKSQMSGILILFTGLKRWQILMFYTVCLRKDSDQNVTFQMDKWLILKNQNWILLTCDPFTLIVTYCYKIFFKCLKNLNFFPLSETKLACVLLITFPSHA